MVSCIVSDALKYLFHRGDTTSVDVFLSRYDATIASCQEQIAAGSADSIVLKKIIADMEKSKRTAASDAQRAYQLYQLFCERVVNRLFDEDMPDLIRRPASKPTGGDVH